MTPRRRRAVTHHVRRVSLLAGIAITAVVPIAQPRPAHAGATIVVDTTADEDLQNARCSLREAIVAANTNASYNGCAATGAGVNDMIVFNLDAPTINIGSTPLPAITEWVTIDGGDGRVELHGPGGPAVGGAHGLTVNHDGFGTIIRNLVVNNFADDGIFIDADEVSVLGCFIGTDATGMMAVPNQGFGVQVYGGNGVRIGGATSGGPCTGDCNVISGATNFKANVLVDLLATGALVRGNFIGTDVTGTAAITPNDVQGVVDKGSSDRIGGAGGTTPGGPCTGDCNLISGNNINGGIVIDQAATGAIVQGNYVGTDVTGNKAISNGVSEGYSVGILSYATSALIGGTTPEARNIVSGNKGTGVQVRGISATVQGNYLGTNSAGAAAVPNSGPGVTVYQANSATIGGTAPGAGNLLSGSSNNGGSGVQILQSTNTQIVGNLIGTTADGAAPLPNLSAGVDIYDQSSNNTVGGQGAGAGNIMAFNGANGVRVDADVPQVRSNTIRGNSIYANGDAGIALTANGNDNLAPPTIDGLGPLHGTSCAPCAVEIFSDAEDEGRVFEGSVFTNDGNWTFNGPLSGPHVTATNTDMSNNTSEFSAPVALTTPTPAHTPTLSPTPTIATSTATRSRTPSLTPTQTASATNTANATPTRTPTHTTTPTHSPIPTPTNTPSPTRTSTHTPTASATTTPANNATGTATAIFTPTETATRTATATAISSQTPTKTSSQTDTATPEPVASETSPATSTATRTLMATPANTSTATKTRTEMPTQTVTASLTQTGTRTASPTGTPSSTPTATRTPTSTATATGTVTRTVGISPTSIPTSTSVPCIGDCGGTSNVGVNDLIVLVNIALGTAQPSACPHGVPSGAVDIALIIQAVNNALDGCPQPG